MTGFNRRFSPAAAAAARAARDRARPARRRLPDERRLHPARQLGARARGRRPQHRRGLPRLRRLRLPRRRRRVEAVTAQAIRPDGTRARGERQLRPRRSATPTGRSARSPTPRSAAATIRRSGWRSSPTAPCSRSTTTSRCRVAGGGSAAGAARRSRRGICRSSRRWRPRSATAGRGRSRSRSRHARCGSPSRSRPRSVAAPTERDARAGPPRAAQAAACSRRTPARRGPHRARTGARAAARRDLRRRGAAAGGRCPVDRRAVGPRRLARSVHRRASAYRRRGTAAAHGRRRECGGAAHRSSRLRLCRARPVGRLAPRPEDRPPLAAGLRAADRVREPRAPQRREAPLGDLPHAVADPRRPGVSAHRRRALRRGGARCARRVDRREPMRGNGQLVGDDGGRAPHPLLVVAPRSARNLGELARPRLPRPLSAHLVAARRLHVAAPRAVRRERQPLHRRRGGAGVCRTPARPRVVGVERMAAARRGAAAAGVRRRRRLRGVCRIPPPRARALPAPRAVPRAARALRPGCVQRPARRDGALHTGDRPPRRNSPALGRLRRRPRPAARRRSAGRAAATIGGLPARRRVRARARERPRLRRLRAGRARRPRRTRAQRLPVIRGDARRREARHGLRLLRLHRVTGVAESLPRHRGTQHSANRRRRAEPHSGVAVVARERCAAATAPRGGAALPRCAHGLSAARRPGPARTDDCAAAGAARPPCPRRIRGACAARHRDPVPPCRRSRTRRAGFRVDLAGTLRPALAKPGAVAGRGRAGLDVAVVRRQAADQPNRLPPVGLRSLRSRS